MIEAQTRKNLVEKIIHSTVRTVKMTMELRIDNSGINMSYNFIGNYIGVDLKSLFIAIEEVSNPIAPDLYVKTLTINEDRPGLLQTLDRTVEIYNMKRNYSTKEIYNDLALLAVILEEHEMNLLFEETAWTNAEKLNEKYQIVDPLSLESVKEHSLSTYRASYQADLSIYNRLLKETNEQIA